MPMPSNSNSKSGSECSRNEKKEEKSESDDYENARDEPFRKKRRKNPKNMKVCFIHIVCKFTTQDQNVEIFASSFSVSFSLAKKIQFAVDLSMVVRSGDILMNKQMKP